MRDHEPARMFQGSELTRLLLFLAIALAGWSAVWYYLVHRGDEAPEPEAVVSGPPAPVVPDASPEFETVADRKPLTFRDMAAYDRLLTRARAAPPAELASNARRDVTYAHLWNDPAHYRGVPVHLLGNVRRVLRYESNLSKNGWLYEAWVILPDLPRNPYVCVFEDAPRGFPLGEDVSERVVFNGFFLKIMRYQAHDTERGAPLLVGRIGWTPRAIPAASPNRNVYWMAGAVGVMFSISLVRWVIQLRRSLAPRRRPSFLFERPAEEISPEELSEFLGNVPPDGSDPPRD